jgi:signal transduction histidine kinase
MDSNPEFDERYATLLPLVVLTMGSGISVLLFLLMSSALHQRNRAQELPDDVLVLVDSDRLQQVLANLLSNAAKFSPAGGVVRVDMSVDGARARVAVSDCGPGIAVAFRDRIFQKFTQADSSDTRQQGGTGLGLAISKELIERMEGAIGFTSEEGAGSCFYFELPVVQRA